MVIKKKQFCVDEPSGRTLNTSEYTRKCAAKFNEFMRSDEPANLEQFMDELRIVVKAVGRDYQKVSVCKKGCSYCCAVPVEITSAEAYYIQSNTGREATYKKGFEKGSYCPFHDDKTKSCTIYEYRPMACITFASADSVEHCKDPNTPHEILTIRSAQGLRKPLQMLYTAAEDNAKERPDTPAYADIREWFHD